LCLALKYTQKNQGTPNDLLYLNGPIGESFYPAPVVGYSQVTTKTVYYKSPGSEVQSAKAGKTITQFYTAKDFPVMVRQTELLNSHIKHNAFNIFNNIKDRHIIVSQGYAIETNDMHGKMKKTRNLLKKMEKRHFLLWSTSIIHLKKQENTKKLTMKLT
jgi:hypothetical protein